jgi:hypothetical protein
MKKKIILVRTRVTEEELGQLASMAQRGGYRSIYAMLRATVDAMLRASLLQRTMVAALPDGATQTTGDEVADMFRDMERVAYEDHLTQHRRP